MQIERTDRFKQAYKELTKDEQARAQKTLRLLAGNQRHPSLRVKNIKGAEGIWEARVCRPGQCARRRTARRR